MPIELPCPVFIYDPEENDEVPCTGTVTVTVIENGDGDPNVIFGTRNWLEIEDIESDCQHNPDNYDKPTTNALSDSAFAAYSEDNR